MKSFFRMSLTVFVWFWSVRTILYLLDIYFLRGRDPSTLGNPSLIIALYVLVGTIYGLSAAGVIVYLLNKAAFRQIIIVARIGGVALAFYGFIDDLVIVYFVILRSLWQSLFWILILPLLLLFAFLYLARSKLVPIPPP